MWSLLLHLIDTISLDVPDADETDTVGTEQPRVSAVCFHCGDSGIGNVQLQHTEEQITVNKLR